jgi:hypothetical protein
MPQRSEVENYRITPEQQNFQQKYGSLKKVEMLLRNRTLAEQQRMMSLKQLWQELSGEFDKLQLEAPEQPLEELEGMRSNGTEPPADQSWHIKY